MKNKPIIGIAGELVISTSVPIIGFEVESSRNDYAQSIEAGGGIPVYLPVTDTIEVIERQVSACDGLLIPGGLDVNPLFYDNEPLPLLKTTIPRMDKFQIALIQETIRCNKPVLGTCRGNQVLNVALGGTLYQDISYASPAPLQHDQLSQLYNLAHTISIFENTAIYDLYGDSLVVNSAHHQAINQLGNGVMITAIAPDGIIEGIQLNDPLFVVGVQWHPEALLKTSPEMLKIFEMLVCEASK